MSKWSEESRSELVSRLVELWEQGLSDREIAQDIECSMSTVKNIRKQENLPPNDERFLSTEKAAERRKLYDSGLIDCKIAGKQGVSQSSIYQWRRRNGLPANKRRKGLEKPL